MNKSDKIYIAGHRGLVGSAILKSLKEKGYNNFVTRSRKELDLTNTTEVVHFFESEKPLYVFLAAAKVGGIVANNTYRGEFIYENLMIQNNVIHQAYLHHVKKLLFLGSTCIYPKNCPQPMKEEYLLADTLEYTNEPYAIAKIAGIKMCESYNIQYGTNFISVQPTNLYGPNDNFDLEKSHVLPALIRKIHLGKALENNDWETIRKDVTKLPIEGVNGVSSEEEILKVLEKYGIKLNSNSKPTVIASSVKKSHEIAPNVQIEIWGSGKPMREFLWSEDMADACVYIMENNNFNDLVNLSAIKNNRHPEPTVIASSVKQSHETSAQSNRYAEDVSMNESRKVDSVPHQSIDNTPSEIRNTHINIGTGKEISIKELAETIKQTVGFKGALYFNTEKPDGTLRKLTDTSKLHHLGWTHTVELIEGVQKMYDWYVSK